MASLKRLWFGRHFLAIATLTLAVPIMVLKLPWLPATVLTFVQTVSESTTNATAGYLKDHTERLWRLVAALVLYVAGLFAIFGLAGIALGWCRHPVAQRIAWFCALLVGVTVPFFGALSIGATTDRFYVVTVVYLPIGLAILSTTALFISVFAKAYDVD